MVSKRIIIWSGVILGLVGLILLLDQPVQPANDSLFAVVSATPAVTPISARSTLPPFGLSPTPTRLLSLPAASTPMLRPTPTLALTSPARPTRATVSRHTIVAGDTLFALADRYGLSLATIMAANPNLDPTTLQIGQEVAIPGQAAGQSAGVNPSSTLSPPPESELAPIVIHHTIVAGDTLLALADRYGLSLAAIMAANPDLDPNALQIGQKVVIPGREAGRSAVVRSPPTAPPKALSSSEPEPAPVLERDFFAAVNAERTKRGLAVYAVDQTLVAVARAHAQDMVKRDYFSHVTPEGVTLRDRLKRAGIVKNWVGENIQTNTHTLDQAVQLTLDWFMESQPHRDNILAEPYTRLGVGVVAGPPGWYTYVLVFAGEN